ncbi:hypothetical protein KIL84_002372 [Mauremys mutica]|uniref:Uncharacterized protein n=1 Tax=Mauremys mutica TaxID=74926 RepID=A0A9D3X7C3_9SAUR|nr:hypothetical protein KIL84_002372 [Mauremys mutica]
MVQALIPAQAQASPGEVGGALSASLTPVALQERGMLWRAALLQHCPPPASWRSGFRGGRCCCPPWDGLGPTGAGFLFPGPCNGACSPTHRRWARAGKGTRPLRCTKRPGPPRSRGWAKAENSWSEPEAGLGWLVSPRFVLRAEHQAAGARGAGGTGGTEPRKETASCCCREAMKPAQAAERKSDQ